MKILTISIAAIALAAVAQPVAAAETPDGFVRIGVGRLKLVDKGTVATNGVIDPEADYKTPARWFGAVELGYHVGNGFSLQAGATSPTSTANIPAGSLEGLPNLGNDKFSIFTVSGTYTFRRGKAIAPYIGGGWAFQHTWSEEDRLATDLNIESTDGPMIQGGVEVRVTERFGAYADVKKAFYSTNGTGYLGPNYIEARAKLDPIIIQAGGVIRF